MAEKYIAVDLSTGRFKQVDGTVTSAGAAQAGKIVALDSAGKLDASLIPSGAGGGGNVVSIVATESLTAGDWVNIFNNGGTAAVKKALAQDTTRPATGYVTTSIGATNPVNVYMSGPNAKIPVGSFTAADLGKTVFLSASVQGGCSTTPPSTSGQLIQPLGKIIGIDASFITVEMDLGIEIVV